MSRLLINKAVLRCALAVIKSTGTDRIQAEITPLHQTSPVSVRSATESIIGQFAEIGPGANVLAIFDQRAD